MINKLKIQRNIILLVGLISFIPFEAFSQKLLNKQIAGLYASSEIKIDGGANEWNNLYQAYNGNIEAFYSISNDAENIYLILHATKSRIIEKIIEGGVSVTINNSGKKSTLQNVTVLFPVMPLPICKGTLIVAGKSLTGTTLSQDRQDITQSLDSIAKNNLATSLEKANKQLRDNLKEIKISGISGIIDTIPNVTDKTPYYRTLPLRSHPFRIISISNKDNIRAMTQFDKKGELTYELAIPLKYLEASLNNKKQFFYNIKIHGRGEDGRPGNTWSFGPPQTGGILDQDLEEPTDFWGEYTLAKKP